jgi:hypothetical protein
MLFRHIANFAKDCWETSQLVASLQVRARF